MNADVRMLLYILAALLWLVIVLIYYMFMGRASRRPDDTNARKLKEAIFSLAKQKEKAVAMEYLNAKTTMLLPADEMNTLHQNLPINKLEKKYIRRIQSANHIKRMEAAVYLGLIGSNLARITLETALRKERNYSVRLYMAAALTDIGNKESIPVLIESLINAHRFYRDKVNMLLAEFGECFNTYINQIKDDTRIEISELIIDFSSVYYSKEAQSYLISFIDQFEKELAILRQRYASKKKHAKLPPVAIDFENNHRKLLYKAFQILAQYYPQTLHQEEYLHHSDEQIQNIAVRSLANYDSAGRIETLLQFLRNKQTARSAVLAISLIIEKHPAYTSLIARRFQLEQDEAVKIEMAKILANRIEYFIMKLGQDHFAAAIIKEIMILGRNSQIIDFLNKNKDLEIEHELIVIIKSVLVSHPQYTQEYAQYLNERLTQKCSLIKPEQPPLPPPPHKDKKMTLSLVILLAFSLLFVPFIYVIRHYDILFTRPFIDQLKIFVIDFNYYLAYYSITISLIYLTLLILSYLNVRRQTRLWKVKKSSLLFKKKMLPSVSIIAPAYNEAETIIESANSLLNLKYPDYELIIVNDGSKDNTMEVLIKYFDLTRVDYLFDKKLNTKPVRGIYMNRSLPKLIVVDKVNGGKADSLNTGINISTKEYFCGIDSDSLLEDEALLKLASLTLDESTETPALGGNVFPINGCRVDRGMIKDIRIPQNKLAVFQTVEYIRAFMAGRLGWSHINGLLIISGAFGLFRKERVINVGGYLSSSGKFGKDTVGEDMELVVRISRSMAEANHRYRICYAFNANCWTEVPEDISTLKKQRYRWQKGLIDILVFHRTMLFNPKYGKTGMLATPYFFMFEMIGPLIELQGYIMVVLAFILGLLNAYVATLLFIGAIMLGILVSVSSLLIAEKDVRYFKKRDLATLILFAIIENFGLRQLFSIWRVGAFFHMFRKPVTWDKAQRKGFETKPSSS